MKREIGIHFYINIANFDDISAAEESVTGEVRHSIYALDTFFSSIERYGKKHYREAFVVEKITGSRLHLYVVNENVEKSFEIVSAVSQYAYMLTAYLPENVEKYRSLIPFQIQVGACHGEFYEFEFKYEDAEELTTIGFAPNYAAKLQDTAPYMHLRLSETLYAAIDFEQQKSFRRVDISSIKKYEQNYCYDSPLNGLFAKYRYGKDLQESLQIASKINLNEIHFREAGQRLSYRDLSTTECKKIYGIPFFADVRDFTSQFGADDENLKEMAQKTRGILTTMYDVVKQCNGSHVQFQGDREMALFHDYGSYDCVEDSVVAGLRIIDAVKTFQVSVGVGQAYGKLFAAKIGARGEKDNILIGRTVDEANCNEDCHAKKNQLVISDAVYNRLKARNRALSELFSRIDGHTFCTEIGYKDFIARQSKKQLQEANKQKAYNGAWRV